MTYTNPTWITVCTGCKRDDWADRGLEKTDGETLAKYIENLAGIPEIETRTVSCTMGCERACNVVIQGAGKISYTLGKFDGNQDDAKAIVAYAQQHAASETGQVPFREWPQGVKGHFVSRLLPLPVNET